MKIAILGTGDVGQVLGAAFAALGHQVKMGTRDPQTEKVRAWVKKTGRGVSAGTFAEAAAFGELAVLATAWSGTESALRLTDAKNLAGKLLIDATNPLDFSGGGLRLSVPQAGSGAAQVQRWAQGARVVKAFNCVGNTHMFKPDFPGGPPDMFICGDDAAAKQTVTSLLKDFGWPVIDLGGLENAHYLEALAMIWILHFFQTKNGNHAFKLLRK
jgi:8-hydroxy-5-deazaflavin:NADPH oxidoreductase